MILYIYIHIIKLIISSSHFLFINIVIGIDLILCLFVDLLVFIHFLFVFMIFLELVFMLLSILARKIGIVNSSSFSLSYSIIKFDFTSTFYLSTSPSFYSSSSLPSFFLWSPISTTPENPAYTT